MLGVNRGGHFILTELVKETASQNRLIETVDVNLTSSFNTPIFKGGCIISARLG